MLAKNIYLVDNFACPIELIFILSRIELNWKWAWWIQGGYFNQFGWKISPTVQQKVSYFFLFFNEAYQTYSPSQFDNEFLILTKNYYILNLQQWRTLLCYVQLKIKYWNVGFQYFWIKRKTSLAWNTSEEGRIFEVP